MKKSLDISSLPLDKLRAYERADVNQRKVEALVAEKKDELRKLVNDITAYRVEKARLLGRRMVRTDRPCIPIEDRVKEVGHPITFEEAVSAANCIWKIAMNLEPEPDIRRAINGAKTKLKMINGMVGLIEWPDKVFHKKK